MTVLSTVMRHMKAPPVARAYNGLVVARKHERSFEVVLASTVGVIKARISLHGPCVIRGGNLAPANDQQSACSNF